MTIRKDKLQQAVQMFTGVPLAPAELDRLVYLLAVPEEVLPHLMLRKDAFRGSEKIAEALALKASKVITPGTRRAFGLSRKAERDAAEAALANALAAAVEHNLAASQIFQSVDGAIQDLSRAAPDWQGAGLHHRSVR